MQNILKLAPIFSDHMVLQGGADIAVWGSGTDGQKVKVEINGVIQETGVENGKWQITLPPVSAGGPYTMNVSSGSREITIQDILAGEVWIAGGQSNMEFWLKNSLNAKAEIASANLQEFRYYNVPRVAYVEPGKGQEQAGQWMVCNAETAGDFSAVAYYFGKSLIKALKVPVGIIGCNWGGTSAACWTSEEFLQMGEKTPVYLEEYQKVVRNEVQEEYNRQIEAYDEKVKSFNQRFEKFKRDYPEATQEEVDEQVGSYPWPPPYGSRSFRRPSGLFHNMVSTVIHYRSKGVIFYQGEEDTGKSEIYYELFSLMRKNWRDAWKNSQLPFLFVQLPYYNDEEAGKDWPVLREAQLRTMHDDKDTAMVVATDCGERDNIHPVDKRPVGERLALLAMDRIYGKNIQGVSPIYSGKEIKDDKIILHFDHAEVGLICKGESLKGFEICGNDHVFVKADAVIKGKTVEVSAEGLSNPVAVRYGWANYTEVNLYSAAGLPASPFRT